MGAAWRNLYRRLLFPADVSGSGFGCRDRETAVYRFGCLSGVKLGAGFDTDDYFR